MPIGSADLVLRVDPRELHSGLASARDAVISWADGVKSLVQGIGQGIGQAMVNAATSMAGHFKNVTASIIEARDTARSVGVSTSFIQSFEAMGVSSRTAGRSLIMLSRQVQQATSGNLQARASFEAVGISIEQLRGRNPEQLFGLIADRVRAANSASERLAIVQATMSRGGGRGGAGMAEMLELLERGSQGISEMQARLNRLRLGVTEADADSIKEASKAWKQLGMAVDGVWTQISVRLAPSVKDLADRFVEGWDAAAPVVDAFIEISSITFDVTIEAFGEMVDGAKLLAQWAVEVIEEVTGWTPQFTSTRSFALSVFQAIGTAGAYAFDAIKAGIGALRVALGGVIQYGFAPVSDFIGVIVQKIGDMMGTLADMVNGLAELPVIGDQFAGIAENMNRWGESIRGLGNSARNAAATARDAGREIIRQGVADIQAFGSSVERVNEWFRRLEQTRARGQNAREEDFEAVFQLRQRITQSTLQMEEQVGNFGLTHGRAQIATFERLAESVEGHLRPALDTALESMRQMNAALEGLQITEHFEPSRAMTREMDRLSDLYRRGVIDAGVYAQGVAQAMEHAESALHIKSTMSFAGAALQGSREAVSTVLRAQFSTPVENQQQRLQRIMEEQRSIARTQEGIQRGILTELQRGGAVRLLEGA